jgi:hypothetical protein
MAQPGTPEFSVVAGVLSPSIVGDSDSWKATIGAQGGVIVNVYNLNKSMSILAELNISLQGAKWEENWGEGIIKGRTNLLYANIPVVVRYRTESGFYVEAGIQPGLLLSAKDKYEGTTDDYKDYIKKFDLSIPLGVGYDLKNNLGISARVIPGITNINAGENDSYTDRNFVIALRATYTFKKK